MSKIDCGFFFLSSVHWVSTLVLTSQTDLSDLYITFLEALGERFPFATIPEVKKETLEVSGGGVRTSHMASLSAF